MDRRARYQAGLETRKAVLGADYVSKSLANANDFSLPMQDLVTEYCWNDIWNRPGLDRKSRSMITIAMLVALNRPNELAAHLRGALNNGLTSAQISEILLQTAIYCGVPAAMDSFRVAQQTISGHSLAPKG